MTSRRRSALGILLAVLGLQLAVSGSLASHAPGSEAQLGGHAPALTVPAPSGPPVLELEDTEAGSGSIPSRAALDDRSGPLPREAHPDVLTPWRADDALARAGRLSAPSTAPPLSGA